MNCRLLGLLTTLLGLAVSATGDPVYTLRGAAMASPSSATMEQLSALYSSTRMGVDVSIAETSSVLEASQA